MVTENQILKFVPGCKLPDTVAKWFNEYSDKYAVNSPLRIAAFLAQVIDESGGFKCVREIWGPTKQQMKYERDFNLLYPDTNPTGRNHVATNLGNSRPGDGKKFMGHGYIQITGRTNHTACSLALFGDNSLVANPDLLSTPQYAMLSAFWYWDTRGLNKYADKQWMETITKRINGGLNGFAERVKIYNAICSEFRLPLYKIAA
jgi:putative chitinase